MIKFKPRQLLPKLLMYILKVFSFGKKGSRTTRSRNTVVVEVNKNSQLTRHEVAVPSSGPFSILSDDMT